MPSPMKTGTTLMTNSSIACASRNEAMIPPPPINQISLPGCARRRLTYGPMASFTNSTPDGASGGGCRKTYKVSLRMGAKFDSQSRSIVFSRHPPPDAPSGVEFVNDAIGPYVSRLRAQPGKDIWLMGGGGIIASFLDAQAIDEFVISVVPVFIGDGIPLIARRHRHVPLELHSIERFEDGVVQLHYRVRKQP